ncbi:MAG: hypothetical protein ACJ744_15930 [Gaiellaceae bacterium]
MTLRRLGIGVTLVAVFALLVAVGRWEERRAANKELAGMRIVVDAIGGDIRSSRLAGYRYGPPDCLAYHDHLMLLALQLCFDAQGRLVETVDRRPDQPRYSSLEYKPSLSTIRFPRPEIEKVLQVAAAGTG